VSVRDYRDHPSVLVTGAAGFIGSALCERLHAMGHRVVGYDNLSRGRRELLPQGVRLVEGDIRDGARLQETVAVSRPDWLIHLAAMHFIPECIAKPQETIEVNVGGTGRVLESCRGSSVQSVIFASSAAVYAPTDHPCVEETTPLRPLEVYGESKVAAEQLVRAFQDETGIPTSILRLFNAIGRNETNPHVVPHIFESLQRSDVIRLGNIEPRRDYIDTRDVAEAILAVADTSDGLRVFNVGTGVAHSVKDIVDLLRRILDRPIRVEHDPARMRSTERMLLAADTRKIRRATQWVPRMSLEETMRDLLELYGLQKQRDPNDGGRSLANARHGQR
jgi:UDP-glucose 4-epimerase